jgi:mRNA-degrading endonuclease YafQ of YafQ-DinJ toxin-antitoxin module
MVNQLILLAYVYDAPDDCLKLVDLGSHENFYRDLKAR